MLTVKLKSALSGTPRVPPNRAAQGCQRYYTALLKPAVRWKYCPGVHDFVAIKKKDYQILLYHLMHSSVQKENPIQDSVDQEILGKVFVEEGKKKSKKQNPNKVGRAGLTFHQHSTDTSTEK